MSYRLLIEAVSPDQAAALRRALDRAGIPHVSGLVAGPPPRVRFYVSREGYPAAREAIEPLEFMPAPSDPAEDRTALRSAAEGASRFPWGPVQAIAALILLHLLLVFWIRSPLPSGRRLLEGYALLGGATRDQPWRLLSSLFLHADVPHALWNGLSMVVFAVPLIGNLGVSRTLVVYLTAGLGGGLAALGFSSPGVYILGSSGAVAGLFGGWIAMTLLAARAESLSRRFRLRTLGVALLFLPSLLQPTTAAGQPVSISSHLGGLATGMLIGGLLSSRMIGGTAHRREPGEEAVR